MLHPDLQSGGSWRVTWQLADFYIFSTGSLNFWPLLAWTPDVVSASCLAGAQVS